MNDLIEKLSNLRSQFNCFNENERNAYHTLSEAIKVLSERPEPCEDAVSRLAVRHALCKAVHKDKPIPCKNQTASCLWSKTRVCDYVREIDALPSVTPKRKKGSWIVHYECPKCGEITKDFLEYCPFCNADMRGKQNGKT